MSDKEKIRNLIKSRLNIEYLEVIDESHKHASHKEAQESKGGHFNIMIVSDDYAGKNALARHRMIYAALSDQLREDVHALKIKAMTIEEYRSSP